MASEDRGEAATMPPTNGELHPPSDESAAPSTPGKRKRPSTPEGNPGQTNNRPVIKTSEEEKLELDKNLRYIAQIAAKDDEQLGVFKLSLIPSSPSKPRSKRPKLSGGENISNSIEARVAAGDYGSYQNFLDDVDKASAAVVERQTTTDTTEDTASLQKRVTALKDRLQALVLQALSLGSAQIKTEPTSDDVSLQDIPRRDKKILTLFGGSSSNAKQLFSSLQKIDGGISEEPEAFPEDRLPNGITTTQAVPFNLEMTEKPLRTFGEVFAPRPTLAQLEPPRRGQPWARDPSSVWIDPFDAITNFDAVLGQRHNYSFNKLPSAHWLHYGGISSSSSYWSRRQKQQSDSEKQQGEADDQFPRSIDEDMNLLHGAYSSFAPTFDSSYSVIQSDAKSSLWWAKKGSRRYNTILALHEVAHLDEEQQQALGELDDTTLEEDVKSFTGDVSSNVTPDEADEAKSEDKNVDEVLEDISELLKTLDSFRRNRNLESPMQDESKNADDIGTPSTPSAAELATYETLKSGLAAIISNLPPYAVSKLNGDQLAQLNISQKILVDMPTYSGTMEEDDYSLLQKRIAATAPTATPSRTGAYPTSSAYSQRMYSTGSRPQQSGVGPQGYYTGRPSASTPYTPSGTSQQSYGGIRPQASPSQRPSNLPAYSPGQYPSRATPNGYGPYNGQLAASPGPSYQQNPAYVAGRSASPQKPHAYATPQSATRTAYLNPASGNAQRYYSQQAGQSPAMYGNRPSAAQTPAQYSMSTNPASYNRNATEHAAAVARHKAQLDIQSRQRQQSGTPNPPQSTVQGTTTSQERSESPATKQPSATPTT
ncbi:hypothetical protein UA08_01512 [Talaromyces atroroseus]|uniref:Uncharacterized protein n=1 Tax=Talaromyces atroroseus TaxID=1441469 RepID=A0A1Q5QC96_TALAT|nr:hypothetical protein UA08_01512 [Talaromyces atroroseus]OKL63389.1 hypothetical protein UA08_01512 [Talaromyces atroroseus]